MTTETKFIVGAGIITIILVVAAALIFGKQKSQISNTSQKVDEQQILEGAKNTMGNPNAPVKIVEFGDYQCPACGAAHPILKSVLPKNSDKVYFVFRNFPLSIHPNAQIAAQAAEAASLQGKFWEMHDILYEKQNDWAPSQNPKDLFNQYAQSIGLDVNKFDSDLNSTAGTVNGDYALGNKLGVQSTPTFFINGEMHAGVIPQDQLQQLIDSLASQNNPPATASASASPVQ